MRGRVMVLAACLALAGCGGGVPALDELAAAGQVQADAPLQVNARIEINAPPAKVWAILTNIQNWPAWNASITMTIASPEVKDGSLFAWATSGMIIHSTVRRFAPGEQLAWTGNVLNFHAIHVWTLTPGPHGTTDVTLQESLSGFMIGYFYDADDLRKGDASWLAGLKAATETSGAH
jgi:uncharacterized protein YndB with AHSA1/START domain